MTESIDYTVILADLEAKRAALDHAIASFRQAMAMGALGTISEDGSVAVPSMSGGEVPTGAFLGKSIIEATKLYLEIVKKKQTAKEIMEGLQRGGMESNSKSFLKTVHASLTRARQMPNPPFVKMGIKWGLTGWFPKGISNGSTPKKRAKKNAPKPKATEPAKVAKPNGKAGPAIVIAVAKRANGKPVSPNTQRLVHLVRTKPGLTLQELAKEAGMDTMLANRVMSNIVRGKTVEARDGKYWAAA